MQIFSYAIELVQSFFENEVVIVVASIITLVLMFVIPAMIITSAWSFVKVMRKSVSKKQLEQMKKIYKERKF
jgi:flagellar biogenesis protein FliO